MQARWHPAARVFAHRNASRDNRQDHTDSSTFTTQEGAAVQITVQETTNYATRARSSVRSPSTKSGRPAPETDPPSRPRIPPVRRQGHGRSWRRREPKRALTPWAALGKWRDQHPDDESRPTVPDVTRYCYCAQPLAATGPIDGPAARPPTIQRIRSSAQIRTRSLSNNAGSHIAAPWCQ
eukprot:TRINITY_DN24911_c0_g1_i1.p1 TRINITY_DN24911_c0_g1~~TRINITY_DN24911_c0_g1_i1.p1  ORF type:complete len:180 (-),score=4.36 TRINITY_DN24911_c0_g1_i1:179-718(-)